MSGWGYKLTSMDPTNHTPNGAATLDAEVVEAVVGVRSAYADLLAAIPRDSDGAIGVERALGVSKKLAWQVYRAATSDNPLSSGARVPGRAAARQVVAAAQRVGIDDALAERINEATERFFATVDAHADDRSSFDLMVRSVTGEGIEGHDAELKRTAYRVNRELVGRCCDVDVYTLLVAPSSTPGHMDMCSLRGLHGLRRLRPDVPLVISRHRFDQGEGNVRAREPVFDEAVEGGPLGLVAEFSTEPMPEISAHTGQDGYTRFVARADRLGTSSAVSCYLADVSRGLPIRTPDGSAAIGHIHEIGTPARVLYQDMLIDRRLLSESEFGVVSPELRVLSRRLDTTAWPGDDRGVLLPTEERLVRAGRGAGALSTTELPQYPGMVERTAQRLGVDLDDMVLFRVRVEHPVLYSVVWVRLDLDGRVG